MRKFALAAALGLSMAPVAAADPSFHGTIYSTGFENFENPPFILGQPLVGQDGWAGAPPLSLNAAVISNDPVFSGKQSVQVAGADLVHQDFINSATNGYYDAIGSYRKAVNFDVGTNKIPIVRVEAAVRIDGPSSLGVPPSHACVFAPSATPVPSCNNFFSASVGLRGLHANADGTTVTVGIGELAISSDGHVYGYSGDDNVPTFLTSAPVTLGAWHTLAVGVNFQTQSFSFSVDGTRLPGRPFPFPTNNNTVNTKILVRGSLVVYAAPNTQLQKSSYVAHQDDFSITTPTVLH